MFGLFKIRFTTTLIGRISYAKLRQIHISAIKFNRANLQVKPSLVTEQLLEKYQNDILYSDYIETHNIKIGYKLRQLTENDLRHQENKALQRVARVEPLPYSLRYVTDVNSTLEPQEAPEPEPVYPVKTQFPYEDNKAEKLTNEIQLVQAVNTDENDLDLEVKTRLELYNKSSEHLNWMEDYENYKSELDLNADDWKVNYGTPRPHSKISDVPCGGCGALLHCKDTAIPGYLPSEIFANYKMRELKEIVCQRCYFLKNYNLALQVRVGADDYPKVINSIGSKQNALVVLIVDLLDLPCSIWPGIADLIGYNRPIVVVGNKVDLLPQDDKGFLRHIERNLADTMQIGGFGMCNIKHVALISAKTGFGVEELITKLHYLWQYKGDVFLVGCTNVGKSTLFNALLQSDYCKSQAVDLIQRATTSPWPGTTLNLLKFPILRPSGRRLEMRMTRLRSMKKLEHQERRLRSIQSKAKKDPTFATLVGHIDRTFILDNIPEGTKEFDNYRRNKRIGLNENDKDYALSRWCYDTPGVVQPDQLIHRLTTDELVLTFPKELIKARTFTLQPRASIFIGGLARLDYIEGTDSVRFTVFCSNNLPITICKLSLADEFYKAMLPTDLFAVPLNYPERLKFWPGLQCSKQASFTGIDWNTSCTDVVLSSAGWIAVTPTKGDICTLQGWTPEARGVYFRDCLLPKAVASRGKRKRKSCIYSNDKIRIM